MTREECMAAHPAKWHATTGYTTGRPSPVSGISRRGAICSCGKTYTGWDLGAVLRRMEFHQQEANEA